MIAIFLACGFLGIGYSSISNISLDMTGTAELDRQTGIYITNIVDGVNANSSIIHTYYQTYMDSTVTLDSSDLTSTVSFQITIYNGTSSKQQFAGVVYDSSFYDNADIVYELSGLNVSDIVTPGNSVTFTITFKYKSGLSTITNNELNSYLNFKFEEIVEYTPVPADITGLIPVVIDNDGTVTTISSSNPNWFNYDNKMWANAVLVKTSGTNTRTYYQSNNDVEVEKDDILAYFVWIPRYSYKIWTTGVSSAGQEQEIDIKFVDTSTKETGTQVGEYRTHPAFTFGNTELNGFWVGKFENSAVSTSTCYTSPSYDNCNNSNIEPRILPSVSALGYQVLYYGFLTSLKFAGGSLNNNTVTFSGDSTYGLNSTANTHLLKNRDWGAMAYLSHSKYGINGKIRSNRNLTNSNLIETGCASPSETTTTSTTDCTYEYGTQTSYPQSSTGNISGVFDMSGGMTEYVMGNYNSNPGSSTYTIFNSAFFTNSSNYVDIYTISDVNNCTIATCGGHALSETYNWYGSAKTFITSSKPWFTRGGHITSAGTSAEFYYSTLVGGHGYQVGFRTVLFGE